MAEMTMALPPAPSNSSSPTMGGQSSGPPMMATMSTYFMFQYKIQLLFKGWASQSKEGFALTLAAVFLLGLFHEWFTALELRLQERLASGSSLTEIFGEEPSPSKAGGSGSKSATCRGDIEAHEEKECAAVPESSNRKKRLSISMTWWQQPLARKWVRRAGLVTLLHVLRTGSGYMLMLCAMSYNGGVFLTILTSLGCGYVLFHLHH